MPLHAGPCKIPCLNPDHALAIRESILLQYPSAIEKRPIPATPLPTISTGYISLYLETTRPAATTGLLELAALGSDIRLLVLVGTEAEMLEGLTSVLGATEQ